MNVWPDVYLPPLDLELPRLTLHTQDGMQGIDPSSHFAMYVCGITPYDATHLGHAATYLSFDLINRYKRIEGASVGFVENITDIDEPLLERAQRDSVDWKTLAHDQIELFKSDMTALHIIPPSHFVPATSVMDLIDKAIAQMAKNGFVYKVENDLYFDISSFIPKLPLPLDEAIEAFAQKGGDPNRPGKRHPLDPVLWWANRDGEPGWESSHGFGRPGWHIECCVIALRYLLGEDYLAHPQSPYSIDLQGGGSDLVFPHHFMSAAQGSALLGQPFAHHFVHSGMVGLNGEKMSKSKGNLVFVSSLLQSGVDPVAIRYALLKEHYQSDRMWTEAALERALASVEKIRLALSKEEVSDVNPVIASVIESLSKNLDTPSALTLVENWADQTVLGNVAQGSSAGSLARALDALLGLAF